MKTVLSHIPLLLAIGSFITTVVADATVTYSVVGLPSSSDNEFAVLVDDVIYKLSPSDEDSTILFRVEAPIAETNYRFVELNKDTDDIVHEEEFDREPINAQINQVYGRSWTTRSIKTFERIFPEVGARHKTDLHPEDEIPSIHIVADQDEIDHIHDHYNQKMNIKADVTFIGAHDVQKFSNVNFNIAGRDSRFNPKPSYSLELAGDELLGGYKTLKLRAAASDPTFLRDKMSFDMMAAAGLPGTHISYKRVYLNDIAIGLYVFAENIDKTWIDQNANPFTPAEYKNGVLYKGSGSTNFPGEFSDLRYINDDPSIYAEHGYTLELEDRSGEKGFTLLNDFIKYIDDELKKPISNSTEKEKELVAEWYTYVGVNNFLRNMIFEFLITGWDNYLFWGDNYYLYKCPINHFFVYFGCDMEATFGDSPLPSSVQLEGDYRHVEGFQNRPLPKALLRVPVFRNYFEETLKNITTTIFNPEISFPIIDSLVELLREDVEWDQSLPRINMDKDFSNPPEGDLMDGELVSNGPLNMPRDTDLSLSKEHKKISRNIIDFQTSIDGPTGYKSLMGLKEYIQGKFDSVSAHI